MKIILSTLLVALTITITKAQNSTITGSVQDESGKSLRYVFVADNEDKAAVLTDSTGNFTIAAPAGSKLVFHSGGYRDTSVNAHNITSNTHIILKSASNAAPADLPVETIRLGLHTALAEDSSISILSTKINVEGSRYLFSSFGHGFFTDVDGKQVYNPACLFNYEKLSGFLLLTLDKENVREVARNQVKSFTIYDKADHRFDFEQVPDIDKLHFLQVLASGSKYKIYKLVKTEFLPMDVAHTAGGDRGQDHDEYKDDFVYYVLDVETNKIQEFSLKKKSIKEAFSKETDKVTKFETENRKSIDDSYLEKLGAYINS